jgi:membrane associated rhomboid family serine protease
MMVTAAAADHHQRHHHHGLSTAGHQQQHCFACGGPVLTFGGRSPLLLLLAPSLTLAPWLTPTHSATPLSLSPQINCHALHTIGPHLELVAGPQRFLVTYGAAALVGTTASFLLTPAPSVGASGG